MMGNCNRPCNTCFDLYCKYSKYYSDKIKYNDHMNQTKIIQKRYTPERITSLKKNEIFVFGSNLLGKHMGGAARVAMEKFGAQWRVFEGLTGQSYAIPTLDADFKKVSAISLTISMVLFLEHVKLHKDVYTYYLTKIGCGIAGWGVEEVKTIFQICLKRIFNGIVPENLIIPKEFSNE